MEQSSTCFGIPDRRTHIQIYIRCGLPSLRSSRLSAHLACALLTIVHYHNYLECVVGRWPWCLHQHKPYK
jgi:hypothetical protein